MVYVWLSQESSVDDDGYCERKREEEVQVDYYKQVIPHFRLISQDLIISTFIMPPTALGAAPSTSVSWKTTNLLQKEPSL